MWAGVLVPRGGFCCPPAALDGELVGERRERLGLPEHPSGRGLLVKSCTSRAARSCLDRAADTSLSLLHRSPEAPPTCQRRHITVIPQPCALGLLDRRPTCSPPAHECRLCSSSSCSLLRSAASFASFASFASLASLASRSRFSFRSKNSSVL